ncbi:STAS domain-containing protein [uncultured Pontibacter sp.]|uniref:STAS domain-containing protein n=1 Tax=uncultured Pontibacter sp. TaxID=453356 RepID=UPI0026227FC7|nr:STAS domain-containing protein [uncultured Pontibacter sp.]
MKKEVVVQRMDDVGVMSLGGVCNMDLVQELEKRCQEEILRKAKYILLDCQNMTSLSPTAMRCLLSKTSEAEKAGTTLVLYHLKPDHAKLLRQRA